MSALNPNPGEPKDLAKQAMTRRKIGLASGKGPFLKFLLTLLVAAIADGLQLFFQPLWIPIDGVTALIFFAIWGWRWEILAALVPELTPGVDAFPCWTALAIYLGSRTGGKMPES